MGKLAPADRIFWINRGWQPVEIGFCPSEKAWKREMKRIGQDHEYPSSAGRASELIYGSGKAVVVTLGDHVEGEHSRVQIAAILAHEATHVKQLICEHIGEQFPSIEFEAYAVQAIFQALYQAWLDTRAPDAMKAACARTVTAEA